MIIAPWATPGSVAHTQFDHTSVLKMIEWRWGLEPLTVRDATANNLANELDFAHPKLKAPAFAVPPGPFGIPCPSEGPGNGAAEEATALSTLAQQFGFPIF